MCAGHRSAPALGVRYSEVSVHPQGTGSCDSPRFRPSGIRWRGAAGSFLSEAPRALLLDLKGAWRRPTGLHIGKVKRVELCPEYVALVAQGLSRQFLLLARLGILTYIFDGKFRVFGSLCQTRLKIIQTS